MKNETKKVKRSRTEKKQDAHIIRVLKENSIAKRHLMNALSCSLPSDLEAKLEKALEDCKAVSDYICDMADYNGGFFSE